MQGEDGATLVELLTVIAITSVVMAFVTGTILNALKTERRQTIQLAAMNDAKVAFERVTRDIRGANPLKEVALDRITLDVRRPDETTRTVTYQRAGGSLVATEAAPGPSRSLVGDLVPGQPLFLFHLADGSTATGETAIDPSAVEAVTVHLRVEPSGAGRVVDLENRVVVRNARL